MARDIAAEQEHRADDVGPGEVDDSREFHVHRADLGERLERLPVGHPSSPYRDDGTCKPTTLDLTEVELPLPDERSSAADQELGEDGARVRPDGWWEWHGRELSPERSSAVDEVLGECRAAEGRDVDGNYGDHGLTPSMRRIEAQLDHGHLVEGTEKYAIKDPDRFKEKLARLIERYPGADPNELISGIHDGVRYTFILDLEHYTEGVEIGHERLTNAGYDHIETKPSWHAEEYKGVNSRWREPATDVIFEVQFHTQESWDAKQKTHEAYEKTQAFGNSVEDTERLRAYQRHVSAQVRIPPGALDIQPHKKER